MSASTGIFENRAVCALSPWEFFCSLPKRTPKILLESANSDRMPKSRSLVASDPFLEICLTGGEVLTRKKGRSGWQKVRTSNPMAYLERCFNRAAFPEGVQPGTVSGGMFGYLGYECKDYLEPCLQSRHRKRLLFPEFYFFFTDRAVTWEHEELRMMRFAARRSIPGGAGAFTRWVRKHQAMRPSKDPADCPVRGFSRTQIKDSMTRKQFVEAVSVIKGAIARGDIFQANLSHRLEIPLKPRDRMGVYGRLRRLNPSSFFGVLSFDNYDILSGSPERLLRLRENVLETRPIAGTRRRGADRSEDESLSKELLLSDKERAEHVMLLDLERNDLGRVCEYGSVEVDEFMAIENYSHVKHIVSNVKGSIRQGIGPFDALKAFFPGGTITGAPKIRSMQILDEVETVARGPYTGSMGYIGNNGEMDFNILIRSLFCRGQKAWLHVGAGIVADSDPDKEYDETLHKGEAVLRAV